MALPAMGAIRRAYPGARVTIAALPSIAPLFLEETGASPDEVLAIGDGTPLPAADRILLFPNSFRSAWDARRAGIPERWGYAADFRRALLTKSVRRPKGKPHQRVYYLELVRGLGMEAEDALPRITVREETRVRAGELLASHRVGEGTTLVGFAPGAVGGHAKRWPPPRVAEVIARLVRDHAATAVLVGAAGDRDAAREIESALPSGVGVVDLVGKTDLRLLCGVLSRCRTFVSNDSGAMHVAAALGVPVVAIFGPTEDRVTSPSGDHDVLIHPVFCRPCMLRDCPIDHRCMKGITADAVATAVAARLAPDR